jgi:hypothetical protein
MLISFIGMTVIVYAVIMLTIFYKIQDRTTTKIVNAVKNVLHISSTNKKQTAM